MNLKAGDPMLFDSHCHLNDDKLYPRATEIIADAETRGVKRMVCIGYDPEANRRAMELAERHPSVYAAIGFHPEVAHEIREEDWIELEWNLKNPKVVAIGECGLDYYWDKTHKPEQMAVFRRQLELAEKVRLPVVIHMREATEDTWEILKSHGAAGLRGVMHCYSGSVESMGRFVDLGMNISLAGPVTFKNAKLPKEVAAAIPDARIMIETDSPYLAPMPYRGQDNRPGYLPEIALQVARLRGIPVEVLTDLTSRNASRLFGIPLPPTEIHL
jgi:TatD DNase family protein